MSLTVGKNRPGRKWESEEISSQLCECCHNWVDQRELVWDLEEDRLVCLTCQKSNQGEKNEQRRIKNS